VGTRPETWHPAFKGCTGVTPREYFSELIEPIKEHIIQMLINKDLNSFLSEKQSKQIRKVLLPETLDLLKVEKDKLNQ
jgi:Tfp pilus assembly PilM family ATPase